MRRWFTTAGAALLLFAAGCAVLVGALWVLTEFVDDKEVRLAGAFIFGLTFLLAMIAGIVAAFHALELTSPKSAFGLPDGSIRAIIALILILIFVVMGIYLIEAVFLADDASAEAQGAATQILATIGTLVAAVAAFYFGTAAVTAGTKAATAAVASAQAPARPAASTKGSRAVSGGYELVGLVNPHGLETSYFFEYGKETSYGTKTLPASAGAADAQGEVSQGPLQLEKGWHLRIVAFSDGGTSYGNDAVVTDDPFVEESGGGGGEDTGDGEGDIGTTTPDPAGDPSDTAEDTSGT